MARSQPSLFDPGVPSGFEYRDDVVTAAEEAALLEHIASIAFATFEMRGVIAKRRVAFYGARYDDSVETTGPIPDFLSQVQRRAAAWAGVDPDAFVMALINEYRPGAPIGWHRDAPQYDIVAGISLLSSCRMKLRPYVSPSALARSTDRQPRRTTHEVTLARRSGYLITGEARSRYEHSIPAVTSQRYSITFRTLRDRRRSAPPID